MAYCDYTFYKSEYLGNVITETDFPRLIERASEKLDALTFDRLTDGLPDDTRTAKRIKKAVCALAEKIADFELADATLRNNGGLAVSSVSSGSESIHYASNAVVSEKDQNKELYNTVREYLSDTGLLYAGL